MEIILFILKKNEKGASKKILLDVRSAKPLPPLVRPLEEQGNLESRKLWMHVLKALREELRCCNR